MLRLRLHVFIDEFHIHYMSVTRALMLEVSDMVLLSSKQVKQWDDCEFMVLKMELFLLCIKFMIHLERLSENGEEENFHRKSYRKKQNQEIYIYPGKVYAENY